MKESTGMKYVLVFAVVILLGACATKSGEDYLNSAEENLKNNKLQEAVADFEAFIKDNAENEKTPGALVKLASIYQSGKLKNIQPKEALEKASKIYREVFDNYPNSTQASTALFMSAFILANELQKYETAEVTYKLFLQKFPSHELAGSAREELNNLGLSPEEILERKSTPNI